MNQFYEINGMCLVELPRYIDGSYAFVNDKFYKSGKNYVITGIEYTAFGIWINSLEEKEYKPFSFVMIEDSRLEKPKSKLDTIKDKLLKTEWTHEQAERVCELIAEAYEAGKEAGKSGD